ncbi:SRPBCC family protein [Streptosporangium sp. NPDC000396]|uniref:SRPBCC family protein n=1 Tax=Streptosporangium sp. NPDC000396 TaxID=3366185 RepID=UPI00367CF7DD
MRLTGTLTVGLPPREAFRLFTARGEQDWVAGWKPRFPVPTGDDTVPGTVFETDADGRTTTWIVTGRDEGASISYARVTPGHRAGTVEVTLKDAGGRSEVTVAYDLTPLTDDAARELAEFADGYPAFLRSWQDAIETWLRSA